MKRYLRKLIARIKYFPLYKLYAAVAEVTERLLTTVAAACVLGLFLNYPEEDYRRLIAFVGMVTSLPLAFAATTVKVVMVDIEERRSNMTKTCSNDKEVE